MEKADAELFPRFCSYTVRGVFNNPLVFDFAHQIYTKRAINFQTLSHLDSIGLIRFAGVGDLNVTGLQTGGLVEIGYFNERLFFYLSPTMRALLTGKVEFTRSGAQLSRIAGAEKEEGFLSILIEKWRDAVQDVLTLGTCCNNNRANRAMIRFAHKE